MKTLFPIVLVLMCIQTVHADMYEYTFVGTLPDGASSHSMVADGEIFTARFTIDSTVFDTNPDPNFGVWENAVVAGSLEFSGGYVAGTTDFSNGTAFALNDVLEADSVRVSGESGLSDFVFQASSQDLTKFDSDALPTPGTVINPFPDPAEFEYFQIAFDDEFGTINYFANQANNVTFTATAVPEPGSMLVAILSSAVLFNRRRSMRL